MTTKNERAISSIHSALDKIAAVTPATTIEARAHRVASLAIAQGRTNTALRSAVVDAIKAGDSRKDFMALVRSEMGIDAALSEKDARKAEPAFDSACNAWAYAAKGAGLSKTRKPRAGKNTGIGGGETDNTPPAPAPVVDLVDFTARLGQWIATAKPEDIASGIESATTKAKARLIAEALLELTE